MAWSIKFFISLCILYIITLAVPLPLLQPPAGAQTDNEVQIQLQNIPIQDEKLLVVNVFLTDISNLYGAEIQLKYNPALLTVRDDNRRLEGTQISPGPLIASDDRFVVTNGANAETGQINFAFTLLKPAQPISGQGVLTTVVFEITGDGPYLVEIVDAQLVSSDLQSIPATFHNLRLNGELEPVGDRPGETQTPIDSNVRGWLWAAAIGIVVLLGLLVAGLLFLGARRRSTPQEESIQAPARKIPAGTHSTIRSASLLAEQGTRALEQGNSQRAYELFSRAIELDPANVEAWLGKGLMAQQKTEKRICLQRVLALDPNNKTAKDALNALKMAL